MKRTGRNVPDVQKLLEANILSQQLANEIVLIENINLNVDLISNVGLQTIPNQYRHRDVSFMNALMHIYGLCFQSFLAFFAFILFCVKF
jgi:hypothetical protein